MKITRHDPATLYPKYLGYAHAVEISGASRMLFVSGLNGYAADGKTMPEAFEDQCEMIWSHLRSILASAGMGMESLVSLRTYLASPEHRVTDAKICKKHLGDHEVALTVVSASLLHPSWKLEVEAVAST